MKVPKKILGDIAKFYRGLTYSKGDEVDYSSKAVLRSNNVELETNSLVLNDLKYLRDDFEIDTDKKVKANSILICMSNGSKQHIGKVAFISDDIDFAFGGFMGLILPNYKVNAKYVYYSCVSSAFKHFLNGIGNGIGITNLRFADLSNYALPVPSIDTQDEIVAELDCLSGVIEKQKQQLKELDNLIQAIFYDMFGDPITNEKGWKVKPLGDACGFQQGEQVPIEEQFEVYEEGMVRFLRIVDFTQGNEKPRYVMCKNTKHILQNEQVAIVRYGTPGFVCFGKSGLIANNLFKIIPKSEDIAFRFLVYWLYSDAFQSVIKDNQYGVALQAIKFSTIKDINLIIPPINLQQEFASKIEAIEKQKELIKQSLSETETLFNSRMDYYFN